jgi:hypothetical protein
MLSEYSFFVFVNLALGSTVGNDIICVSKRLGFVYDWCTLNTYKALSHVKALQLQMCFPCPV